MAGALGSLVVEVAANVARFQSDMGKVAQIAERNAAQMQRAFDVVGTSLKSLGAGVLVGLTLDKARSQIEGVIKSAAGLQQLSERTGSTVESLSGLASIAKLSGTDAESLAGGLQKLSKAMVDAQAGGKNTAAAFASLGISTADLKNASPAEVFEKIARAQASYADGADKVAALQALLGKGGANLLPVMKDLAEAGELQAKVTTEQAQQADAYEKTLVRLQAAQGGIYKRIAFELLPVMSAFAEQMLSSAKSTGGLKGAVDDLSANNALRTWAQGVALAMGYAVEAVTGLIKTVRALGGSFEAVFADLKVLGTFLSNGGPAGLAFDGPRKALAQALQERNATVEAANKRYVDLWNYDGTAFTRGLQARFDAQNGGAGGGRGFVNPDLANKLKAPNFRPPESESGMGREGDKFIESLQRQYEQQTKNRFEMLRLEAAQKGVAAGAEVWISKLEMVETKERQLKDFAEQTARIEAERARQGDSQTQGMALVQTLSDQTKMLALNATQQRRVTELRKLDALAIKALGDATQDTLPEVIKQFETMRAKLNAALDDLEARERELAGSSAEGARRAFEAYAEGAANAAKSTEDLVGGALQRLEDALVTFVKTGKLSFSDLFTYMAEEYIRAQIRMSIADFLPGGKGAGGTSLLAMGVSWLKGVSGYANGLPYVPYDNFPAVLHEGERVLTKAEAGAAGSGRGVAFDFSGQTLNVGQGVSRAEVSAALARNNAEMQAQIRRQMREGVLT